METLPNIPGISNPLIWVPMGRSIRYGMWFDGSNDTVLVDGSFLNAKTTGKITGVFQTTSTGIVCVCAATDAGDTASDLRINISSGKLQFAARENSGHDINVKTDATYNDGEAHTFEVKVTASGTSITMDGVLLEASELTYTTGSAASHIWFSDVSDVDMWAMGVRQESVPDNKFLGVVRDIKIYDEDTTTVIGHWAGHGNTNADWLDQGTGNYGMWFDGVNDEVCVGNNAAFNYTTDLDFTITFVASNPSVAQTLISKGNGSTETCWAADLSGGLLRFFGYTSSSSVIGILTGGPAVVAGTLYTARFTFDGTTWKIFVDGVEEKSVTSAGTLRTNTEDVCIGSRSGVYRFFDGVIRDVDVKIDGALVGTWNGYGTTDADWKDQVGSNDGTVAGSPARAVSTSTGWREANDGTVAGSPSRAISTDGGSTWAMETASDADAAAYIALLLNTGTSITPAQISALDTFFLTGKSEGWYSELKRMYLPIWAAAAPNAIDMIGGTSGTYSGTVTHAAGYVQGNGSTGVFDSVTDLVTLGLTTSSASLFYGAYSEPTANSDFYMGALTTAPTAYAGAFRHDSGGGERYIGFVSNIYGSGTIDYAGGPLGVSVMTRTSTGSFGVYKNGDVTVGTDSYSGVAVPALSVMFMARNRYGVSSSHADGKMYCFGVGLGLSETEAKSLANATQTLWETCTGLTLP